MKTKEKRINRPLSERQVDARVRWLPHPEDRCQKCGSKNPSWHAPNVLWNKVTGHPAGLIICPRCFQEFANKIGIITHCVVFQVETKIN